MHTYYDEGRSWSVIPSMSGPEPGTGAARESDVIAKTITRLKKRIAESNWLLRLLRAVTGTVEGVNGGNKCGVCGVWWGYDLSSVICAFGLNSDVEEWCAQSAVLISLSLRASPAPRVDCASSGSMAQWLRQISGWSAGRRSGLPHPAPSFLFLPSPLISDVPDANMMQQPSSSLAPRV